MTRKKIYFLSFCLPFFSVLFLSFFSSTKESMLDILWVSSLLTSILLIFVLKAWEKKMQRAVSFLIQEKSNQLKPTVEAPEILKKLPQEEVTKVEERSSSSQQVEEIKRHYEHQINLMNSSVEKSRERVDELTFEIEKRKEQLHLFHLEGEDLKKENDRLKEEVHHLQNGTAEEVKRKEALLQDYQKTIAEQRIILEKKQKYIGKLEGKVSDLMYEIRSVLHLEDANAPPSSPPSPPTEEMMPLFSRSQTSSYDLSMILQKYVKAAEKFTTSPRDLEFSTDTLELDLRQLFDRFKDETKGIVFVYSQKDDKLLFVNAYTKTLLGWSPEKFLKNFPQLVGRGYIEWKGALSKIEYLKETKVQGMTLRNRRGEEILAQCHMIFIQSGPFASHVMGLLTTTLE